ncbi:hypothetical protein SAMN04488688_104481 [Paenibacillus sp. cl141a]|uniref:hypothetical protein n=1 Tax=Paenibacillus sp. cl141a TaxID=1761877 RepID=UPI0008D82B69|nr:hypothetical protein [Paenibacillus sp. cl141a]SEL57846.1 hypothetical protein SAMN04488688_104481 [Paenibacillus sp. cl141a]
MSDLTSMGVIALIVAGIAAVIFLNFFGKSALHLLLTSIHSALAGIGLILLATLSKAVNYCCLRVQVLSCSMCFLAQQRSFGKNHENV